MSLIWSWHAYDESAASPPYYSNRKSYQNILTHAIMLMGMSDMVKTESNIILPYIICKPLEKE